MGNPASQITRTGCTSTCFIRWQNIPLVPAPASPFRALVAAAWLSIAAWQGWADPYCVAMAFHPGAITLLRVAAGKGCAFKQRNFLRWNCVQPHRWGFKEVVVTKWRDWNNPHTSHESKMHQEMLQRGKLRNHFSVELNLVYFSLHEIFIFLYRWTQLAEELASFVSDLFFLAFHLLHLTEFLFYF